MKLLLLSTSPSPEQGQALAKLVGRELHEIKVAYIENAYDVYDDEASLIEGREELKNKGYDIELVDLRDWKYDRYGLYKKLASKDVFLLTGATPIICAR
jgi:hypothetical protein